MKHRKNKFYNKKTNDGHEEHRENEDNAEDEDRMKTVTNTKSQCSHHLENEYNADNVVIIIIIIHRMHLSSVSSDLISSTPNV